MILASGAMLIVPWIIGQSMTDLTRTLFGRSDLELILSSPVKPRSLLAARALSIAIGAVASVGLLLAPLANVATLRGHPHWLCLYPALLTAGLAGTGFGVIPGYGPISGSGAVTPRRCRIRARMTAVRAKQTAGVDVKRSSATASLEVLRRRRPAATSQQVQSSSGRAAR